MTVRRIAFGCGSETLGPQQGVGQVEQQARGDEAGECIIEDHVCSPERAFRAKLLSVRVTETRQKSEPFAGVGVTHRRHEEAEAEGHHKDVQHELLLCGIICGARSMAFSCWSERCHPAHRFSRRGPAQRYRNLIKVRPSGSIGAASAGALNRACRNETDVSPSSTHSYEMLIFRYLIPPRFQMAF
jgi:hypothetical protein